MFLSRKSSVVTSPETPAEYKERVAAEIAVQRMRDKYELEVHERNEKLEARSIEVQKKHKTVKTAEELADRARRNAAILNYTPLIVISALAISGQYGYLSTALALTFGVGTILTYVVAVLSAAALESITLFLGYHAMLALRRKDSSAGLVFASIVLGGLVAFMNYSHFATSLMEPTATAVIFGLFSFANPFLWRVKIRSEHRDVLKANGEIDERGLKLPRSVWLHHPIKAYKVTRAAAWTGHRDRATAVAAWESSRALSAKLSESREVDLLHAEAEIVDLQKELVSLRDEFADILGTERVKYELVVSGLQDEITSLRDEFLEIRQSERETAEIEIADLHESVEHLRQALADATVKVERIDRPAREKRPALENGNSSEVDPKLMAHPKWADGLTHYSASVDSGNPLTQVELATYLGLKSRALASAIMKHDREDRERRELHRYASAVSTEAPTAP